MCEHMQKRWKLHQKTARYVKTPNYIKLHQAICFFAYIFFVLSKALSLWQSNSHTTKTSRKLASEEMLSKINMSSTWLQMDKMQIHWTYTNVSIIFNREEGIANNKQSQIVCVRCWMSCNDAQKGARVAGADPIRSDFRIKSQKDGCNRGGGPSENLKDLRRSPELDNGERQTSNIIYK